MFTHAATAFLDNPPFPARPSQIDPSSRSRAARYIQQYTDGVFRPVPSPGRLRVERRRYMVEMEDRMQLVAPRWNRGWLLAGRSALEHRAQETGAITQTALQLGVWALSAKNTPLSLATAGRKLHICCPDITRFNAIQNWSICFMSKRLTIGIIGIRNTHLQTFCILLGSRE